MIQTDLQTLRRRLVEAGIPQAIADDPNKGTFLAALLGQRLAGEEVSVTRAAETAGVEPNTVRVWRKRSPAFGQAEHRARYGTVDEDGDLEPYAIEADAPPEPAEVKQLRARVQRSLDVCADIGTDRLAWRSNEIDRNERIYNIHRQAVLETINELRQWNITEPFPIPEPMPERPPKPFKPPSFGYDFLPAPLWPPSAANQIALQQFRKSR